MEYDPSTTSVEELEAWVRECGYHCAGESAPTHVRESAPAPHAHHTAHADLIAHGATAGVEAPHSHAVMDLHEGHGAAEAMASPHELMGHGGHAGMSMADMVRDMRNRFVVAAVLSLLITLYSPMGRDLLGFTTAAPFGLRDDVVTLLLSLPVVFYSAWIFFDGPTGPFGTGPST